MRRDAESLDIDARYLKDFISAQTTNNLYADDNSTDIRYGSSGGTKSLKRGLTGKNRCDIMKKSACTLTTFYHAEERECFTKKN